MAKRKIKKTPTIANPKKTAKLVKSKKPIKTISVSKSTKKTNLQDKSKSSNNIKNEKETIFYSHLKIESKWQKLWQSKPNLYKAVDNDLKREKMFVLVEFPFPSAAGLHAGHVRSYTALDIVARKNRMLGKNVLYPIGWDAFGLPTENYAIKTGLQPAVVTKQNTKNFERQLKSLGFSFDWNRVVNTTDPEYYKWTQWIFLQMFKKGLAYRDKISINWCPKDKTGLANEEVISGCCERCGTKVEKRIKEQWMLAITKYADRLDKDLDKVDYPERVKLQQRNWIGRSEGAEIDFQIQIEGTESVKWPEKKYDKKVTVFTTRPDTLFGVTYVVFAPEHPLITELQTYIKNWSRVKTFIDEISLINDIERTSANTQKSGILLEGLYVLHPVTGQKISLWVADYVLATYGTGAVMAVPSHDERDLAFAKTYNLKILEVIDKETGLLINSDQFTGSKPDIASKLIAHTYGRPTHKYKLRDWVFSRQRYWGEPIPVIHCSSCGIVAVPEKDLPVMLPKIKQYQPTENGESPLAVISSWVNTKCPTCKKPAKRETDTMPNWAGSSWYYLRYTDSKNTKKFADLKKLEYWTPVNWYNGGMEHTTLHLLYSRFWHKFLFDLKLVPTTEPYSKRTSHGLIMSDDGTKMSKSKGNVVNPDEIIKMYGADTLRLYEMFIGPFEQSVTWNNDGLIGPRRFIEKVFQLLNKVEIKTKKASAGKITKNSNIQKMNELSVQSYQLLHKTIKKVGEDIDILAMNTAVSSLMILLNQLEKELIIPKKDFINFISILAPFVPFVAEELHEKIGGKKSVTTLPWPEFDPKALVSNEMTIAIQINGKIRSTLVVDRETAENEQKVLEKVLDLSEISNRVGEKLIIKIIYIKGKVINLVCPELQ